MKTSQEPATRIRPEADRENARPARAGATVPTGVVVDINLSIPRSLTVRI
jgi:hypothetical protein